MFFHLMDIHPLGVLYLTLVHFLSKELLREIFHFLFLDCPHLLG